MIGGVRAFFYAISMIVIADLQSIQRRVAKLCVAIVVVPKLREGSCLAFSIA